MTSPDLIDGPSGGQAPERSTSKSPRTRIAIIAAAVAVLFVAGVAAYVATRPDDTGSPAASTNTLKLKVPVGALSCANPESFIPPDETIAFGGTATSVGGNEMHHEVTLDVSKWYKGDDSVTQVTLRTAGPNVSETVDFQQGGDYLVMASAGQVWVCLSGPNDTQLRTLYDGWFG